jgi:hypothetical protein
MFGSVLNTAVSPPMNEQSDSWETRVRVDKAWRDEYLQNDMSLRAEFDTYGDEQDQQIIHVANAGDHTAEE